MARTILTHFSPYLNVFDVFKKVFFGVILQENLQICERIVFDLANQSGKHI